MDLAERIGNERAIFEWFPDRFADETIQPRFSEADVEAILWARTKAGSALAYLTKAIPTPENMPTLSELVRAHTALRDVARLNGLFEDGAIPVMIVTGGTDLESARFLADFIDYIEGLNADVPANGEWYRAIVAKTAKLTDSGDGRMLSLLERWADLAERGALYVQHAVDIGKASHDVSELDEAFERLSSGKSAFKWPIGNKELKDLLATVRVGQAPPCLAAIRLPDQIDKAADGSRHGQAVPGSLPPTIGIAQHLGRAEPREEAYRHTLRALRNLDGGEQ
jgi:hypothetical protein